MSRDLYRILVETRDKAKESINDLYEFCYMTGVSEPPILFKWIAIKEFCEFLLDNEKIENEKE